MQLSYREVLSLSIFGGLWWSSARNVVKIHNVHKIVCTIFHKYPQFHGHLLILATISFADSPHGDFIKSIHIREYVKWPALFLALFLTVFIFKTGTSKISPFALDIEWPSDFFPLKDRRFWWRDWWPEWPEKDWTLFASRSAKTSTSSLKYYNILLKAAKANLGHMLG